MNNNTLSRQLFIRIAPIIILTIFVIGLSAFQSANKEINTVYDAQLISNANVLWTLVSDETKELNKSKKIDDIDLSGQISLNDSADDYADSRMFRVWRGDDLLLYSDTAPPISVERPSPGFTDVYYDQEHWRVYVVPLSHNIFIEVGEMVDLRNTLVANILIRLSIPLLFLLPIVTFLIWIGIKSGLGTIRNLVGQIRSRSPNDLSHVDVSGMPNDLLPLGKSLNQLFSKLNDSFTAEKRFSDHAAHQLRTPLATIKLQLQMLEKETGDNERRTLVSQLLVSNDRASKMVGMLLSSARLSHESVELENIPLYPAVADVMAQLGTLATVKSIELSLEGDETLRVVADKNLLAVLLANLIENAVKYTPSSGSVQVSIARHKDTCLITIADTGPGIPEAQRTLVFERFYRIDQHGVEGAGLGLSMVSEIIGYLSGEISLKTAENGHGLLVEVTLPAVGADT